jgi:hypothetical protein
MPGISKGFHAKISLLARKKSTSALSYLEESAVPTHTFLSVEFSRLMRNLLHALRRLEGSGSPIGVWRLLRGFLPDGRKFLGGDDR